MKKQFLNHLIFAGVITILLLNSSLNLFGQNINSVQVSTQQIDKSAVDDGSFMPGSLTLAGKSYVCPPDAFISSYPNPGQGAHTSANHFTVYQSFSGLPTPITHIKFWGIQAIFNMGWVGCISNPMPFSVSFFENNGSSPGTLVFTENVILYPVSTGEEYGGYPAMEFTYIASAPVALTDGWFSIKSIDPACTILLINNEATTAHGSAKQHNANSNVTNNLPFPIGFCMSVDQGNCPAPYSLAVSNVNMVVADLSWTENGTAQVWDIEVVLSGNPPTGNPTFPGVTGNPFTLTGLTPGTAYDVYVRSVCGTNTSLWANSLTFNTHVCAISEQCEYTFRMTDNYGDGWSGNTMSIKQNGSVIQTISLVSGSGPEDIMVGLCNGVGFELFWNDEGYFHEEVGIEILNPDGVSIYYKPPGTGAQNTLLYSDVTFCPPPFCFSPNMLTVQNIGVNVATISWTAGGTETAWEYAFGAAPFNMPSGNGIANSSGSSTINGLSPATTYEFYVRADCGNNNFSTWEGPYMFSTLCEINTLPFTEDFENGTVCWNIQDVDGGGETWELQNMNHTSGGMSSFGHHSGSQAYSEAGQLISPEIFLPTGAFVELSFWSFNTGTTAYGSNSVLISTDNWQTSHIIWSPVSVSESTWEEVLIDISAYSGQTVRLGFEYEGTDAHNWFIDDVEIYEFYPDRTVDLKVFLEGLYDGGGQMRKAQDVDPITWMYNDQFGGDTVDMVTVELWMQNGTLAFSESTGLLVDGDISFTVPGTFSSEYYIYVRHRNSIALASAIPVSFSNILVSYDFTVAASQAYFDNQQNLGGVFGMFAGDVNQDGSVGALDMIAVDNASRNFLEGYVPEDVNGDAEVGAFDLIIVDNNSRNFVFEYLPF